MLKTLCAYNFIYNYYKDIAYILQERKNRAFVEHIFFLFFHLFRIIFILN